MHCNRQQSLVSEWLGPSVTVRVRVRLGSGNGIFLLFLSVLKLTNTFVLLSWYGVDVATLSSKNYDVKMM